MTDWWQAIENELDAQSVSADDPWAAVFEEETIDLTDDQQRFLATLADQPAIVRLGADDSSVEPIVVSPPDG